MPETPASPIEGRQKKPRHRAGPPIAREWRHVQRPLEIRSVSDGPGNTITLEGAPIVYDTPYVVFDMFGEFEETMKPGVATNALASPGLDVRFLFNHDGMPLGRTTNGTLSFADGPQSLTMRVVMDARSQLANDLAIAVERGDINQMSCGFMVGLDEWNDDWTQRSIYRFAELFDVSAVTYPASPTTSVELGLRAMLGAPVESRARIRAAWKAAREVREGKVLSAENAGLLQQALEALHAADDVDIPNIINSLQTIDQAVDDGQAALAEVLGKANPDDDEDSEDDDSAGADDQDGTASASDTAPAGMSDATGSRDSDAPAETRSEDTGDDAGTPRRNVALELEAEQLRMRANRRRFAA